MAFTRSDIDAQIPQGTDFASTIDDKLAQYHVDLKERFALEHRDLKTGNATDTHAEAQGRHIPGKVSAVLIDTNTAILASTGNSTGGLAWAYDTNIMYVSRTGGTFTAVNVVKDSRADDLVDPTGHYEAEVAYTTASAATSWQSLTTTRLFFTASLYNLVGGASDDHYLELWINDNASDVEVLSGAYRRVSRVVSDMAVGSASGLRMQLCGIIPKGFSWKIATDLAVTNGSFYQILPI